MDNQRIAKRLLRLAKAIVAAGGVYYDEDKGPRTPWGPAQVGYPITKGVVWYSTAGHGGLGVARSVASKKLTPQARKMAMKSGGRFWYEEDADWAIPFFENPEWEKKFAQLGGGRATSQDEKEKTIRRWNPKYFELMSEDIQEPIPMKDLKEDDVLRIRGQNMVFWVVGTKGRSLLLRGDWDKRTYKLSPSNYEEMVEQVYRNKKSIWKKEA